MCFLHFHGNSDLESDWNGQLTMVVGTVLSLLPWTILSLVSLHLPKCATCMCSVSLSRAHRPCSVTFGELLHLSGPPWAFSACKVCDSGGKSRTEAAFRDRPRKTGTSLSTQVSGTVIFAPTLPMAIPARKLFSLFYILRRREVMPRRGPHRGRGFLVAEQSMWQVSPMTHFL